MERECEGQGRGACFAAFCSGSATSSKVLNCIIRPAVHNLIKLANGSRVSLDSSNAGCCGYASACCCLSVLLLKFN